MLHTIALVVAIVLLLFALGMMFFILVLIRAFWTAPAPWDRKDNFGRELAQIDDEHARLGRLDM